MKKKVSVALTTYNGSKYIVELLDSLRQQTYLPDEVLIADDRSTDDTVNIIKRYIEKYSLKNWNIYVNEHNLGWMHNFKNVISKTTGDYVFTADQDDIWHKDKIQRYLECFQKSKAWLIVSDYHLIGSQADHTPDMYPIKYDRMSNGLRKVLLNSQYDIILRPGCVMAFNGTLKDIFLKIWTDNIPHDSLLWTISGITNNTYYLDFQSIDFRREENNASASIGHDIFFKKIGIKKNKIVNNWYFNSNYVDSNKINVINRKVKWNQYRYELLFNHKVIYWIKLFKYRNCYLSNKQYVADLYYFFVALVNNH